MTIVVGLVSLGVGAAAVAGAAGVAVAAEAGAAGGPATGIDDEEELAGPPALGAYRQPLS